MKKIGVIIVLILGSFAFYASLLSVFMPIAKGLSPNYITALLMFVLGFLLFWFGVSLWDRWQLPAGVIALIFGVSALGNALVVREMGVVALLLFVIGVSLIVVHVRRRKADARVAESANSKDNSTPQKAQPWIRLFARTTDYWIAGLIIGVAYGIITPRDVTITLPRLFFLLLPLILVEAGLLSTCGTTPGKWLFGIRIRDSVGKRLTFLSALNRSFWVWLDGLGFCLPILCPISLIRSYSKLRKNGITRWDQNGRYMVLHSNLGVPGFVFTGLLVLFYLTLTFLPMVELVTRRNINELEKLAVFLDEDPVITFTVEEGQHYVLLGGNLIRAVYYRYPPFYATTVILPHAAKGVKDGLTLMLPFKGKQRVKSFVDS